MAKSMFDKDWVEAYFENGIDIKNRRVFLDSDIGGQSIGAAIRGLYLMETESNIDPVEMFISSFGGCLYDTLALYDIINTVTCPVHTFTYGKCMSGAVLLLAAGEKGQRWVTPHVSFMFHDLFAELEGTRAQLQHEYKHTKQLGETWVKLIAKNSSQNSKWWDARAKKSSDFYFSAEEAIDWGLADQIWVEKE